MGRKFKIIQIWERFCCMGCRDHIVDQLLGLSLSRCAVEHPNGTGETTWILYFLNMSFMIFWIDATAPSGSSTV